MSASHPWAIRKLIKKVIGFAASLWLLAFVAGSAGAQAGGRDGPSAPIGSISYSVSGPAIVRIEAGRDVAIVMPGTLPDQASDLGWRPVLQLEPEAYEQGWRLGRLICDSQAPNVCLLERHRTGSGEWTRLDLASPAMPVWLDLGEGRVLDYDSGSSSILRLVISDQTVRALIVESLSSGATTRTLWQADSANTNAYGRFLRSRSGERSILVMTGGPTVHWQVIGSRSQSDVRPAPGALNAAFEDGLYYLAASPSGNESWYGRAILPLDTGSWGPDRLIYRGNGGARPPIVAAQIPGRLWQEEKDAAFLPNGALLAVTRRADGYAVSEICRSSPEQTPTAEPVAAMTDWLDGAVEVTLFGGAPASRIILVRRKDLGGQIALRMLVLSGRPDSSEAVRPCRETGLAIRDLPVPSSVVAAPDLVREARSVTADDGATISYDVIRSSGRVGKILIRAYGAYGMTPEAYLARPLEQQWVAGGNTLVVPRLRGDAGEPAWVEAGRGDHKRRSAGDLVAVAQDVLDREPSVRRVNLLGFSAGGFVSARASFDTPGLFDRVVMISSLSDLSLSEARDESSFDRAEFGSSEGGFPTWLGGREADAEAPVFIVLHGSHDEIVPAQASVNFAAYARSLGYPVKGQLYEGIGHELANASDVLRDIEDLW